MWYCYRRGFKRELPFRLQRGKWYREARPAAEEHSIPTAYLLVGEEEVQVPCKNFIVRETKAEYAYPYRRLQAMEQEPGEPVTFDGEWVSVCPEGHEGPSGVRRPEMHDCGECGRSYPVQLKDSGLVINA